MVEWAGELEREVRMNVDANGRKRLEVMKKALAAGVPLAGLLAGMACATEAVAGDGFRTAGIPMLPPRLEERRVMEKMPPRAARMDEGRAKAPKRTETPEAAEKPELPAGEGEKATGSRE